MPRPSARDFDHQLHSFSSVGSSSSALSSSGAVSFSSSSLARSVLSSSSSAAAAATHAFSSSSGARSVTATRYGNVSRTTTTASAQIPLTTIFTPPARCADIAYTYSTFTSGLSTFWRGANATVFPACYPPLFDFQTSATTAQYSPGVCPSGYTAATSATNVQRQAAMSWCCPSSMSYAQDYGCYTTVSTPTVVMLNPKQTTTMTEPFVAADYYIQVGWDENQLSLFTPASAPILTSIPTATATGNSSALNNMTTEEIAGMSIGLPVAVAVIALACYAIWHRKRRPSRGIQLLDTADDDNSPVSVMTEHKRSDSAQVQTPEYTAQGSLLQQREYGLIGINESQTQLPPPLPLPQQQQHLQQMQMQMQMQMQTSTQLPMVVQSQTQTQQPRFSFGPLDRQSIDETEPAVEPR